MAIFDVRYYGAACDLVTDDTAAVRAARDAAAASPDPSNTILIGYPGCRMDGGGNGGVSLSSNMTLEGEVVAGQPRTKLFSSLTRLDGGSETVIGFNTVTGDISNVSIKNLNVYNHAAQYVSGDIGGGVIYQGPGFYINGLTIDNCETHSRSFCGVVLQNARNVTIQNSSLGGANEAIYLAHNGVSTAAISNVTIQGADIDPFTGTSYSPGPGSVGIALRGATDVAISNCHITGAWDHSGICLRNEVSTGVQITSNRIDCSANGAIVIIGASNVTIYQNTITGTTGTCIQLWALLGSTCDGIRIDSNSIADPDPSATSAYAMVIAADTSGGASTAGHFTNVLIKNNTCSHCPQGINVDFDRLDAAGSARVFGNIIDFDQTGATTSPNPGLWVKSMQHKADFCCAENNQVLHYYVTAWGSGVKLDENCATSDCRQ
jgi:hypothetical protein